MKKISKLGMIDINIIIETYQMKWLEYLERTLKNQIQEQLY
jgi:hypothetical protein